MSGIGDKIQAPANADIGKLTTQDWIQLTTFFTSAIHDTPRTESKMRLRLGMQAQDEFRKEFKDTVETYDDLADLGEDFRAQVMDKALALADDIVHYNARVQVYLPKLVKLIENYDEGDLSDADVQTKLNSLLQQWRSGEAQGKSVKIRTRMRRILERLIQEAESRAQRADELHSAIMGVHTEEVETDGILDRLRELKTDFDERKTDFDLKFGSQSAEAIALTAEKKSIEDELATYQKKDDDETIVLSTSPLYLLIPVAGPFIMAGVLIGVGVDMANVRAKIKKLQEKAEALQHRLDTNGRFKTYYEEGSEMTTTMVDRCEKLAPRLERLGLSWRSIAKDMGFIVATLSDDGRSSLDAGDWFDFELALELATDRWADVGDKADHFRSVAQPKKAETPTEVSRGASRATG